MQGIALALIRWTSHPRAKTHSILLACFPFGKASGWTDAEAFEVLVAHSSQEIYGDSEGASRPKIEFWRLNKWCSSGAVTEIVLAVTLFFPLFWAYNDEVICGTQRIDFNLLYLRVHTGCGWIGTLLRNN